MRFHCADREEHRRAKRRRRDDALREWHGKIAWLPIRIGVNCHWLEVVMRRRCIGQTLQQGYFFHWEYRSPR